MIFVIGCVGVKTLIMLGCTCYIRELVARSPRSCLVGISTLVVVDASSMVSLVAIWRMRSQLVEDSRLVLVGPLVAPHLPVIKLVYESAPLV